MVENIVSGGSENVQHFNQKLVEQYSSTRKSFDIGKENSKQLIQNNNENQKSQLSRKKHKLYKLKSKAIIYLQSLPRTTFMFLIVSFIDVCAVFAFTIDQIYKKAKNDQLGQDSADAEKLHIIVIEIISILFYIYYVWDAIYRENSVELIAATLQVLVLCGRTYWFTYSQHNPMGWLYFIIISVLLVSTVLLAYLTYMHFGWRIYSKIQCDPRSKEGMERMRILFMQNRFTTILKLDFQFCLILFVVELTMTMETSVASLQLWLTKAILSQSMLVLLLLSPWCVFAYKAVKYANQNLLRFLVISTPFLSILIPLFSTVYVILPGNFSRRTSNVTYVLSLVLFFIIRPLGFIIMLKNYKVLVEFQKINGPLFQKGRRKHLDFGSIEEDNIKPILLPLVRGAWLIKKAQNHPRKRRFFQLSADGTTLRWAWNKYIYLFYITQVSRRDEKKEIILKLGDYEPDLHVKFTDQLLFEQWYEGLKYQHESLLDPRGEGFATVNDVMQKDITLQRKQSNFLGNLKPSVSRRPQCRQDPNAENLNQILQFMKYAQDLAKQMNTEGGSPINGTPTIANNDSNLNRALSNFNLQQINNNSQRNTYFQHQKSQDMDIQNTLKRLIDTQQSFLNPGQNSFSHNSNSNSNSNINNCSNIANNSNLHSNNTQYNQNISSNQNGFLNSQSMDPRQTARKFGFSNNIFGQRSLSQVQEPELSMQEQEQQQQQEQQQLQTLQQQYKQKQLSIPVDQNNGVLSHQKSNLQQQQFKNSKFNKGFQKLNGGQSFSNLQRNEDFDNKLDEAEKQDASFGQYWNQSFNQKTKKQHNDLLYSQGGLCQSSNNTTSTLRKGGDLEMQVQQIGSYIPTRSQFLNPFIPVNAESMLYKSQSVPRVPSVTQLSQQQHQQRIFAMQHQQRNKVQQYQQSLEQLQNPNSRQQQQKQDLQQEMGLQQKSSIPNQNAPVWGDIKGSYRQIGETDQAEKIAGNQKNMRELQQGNKRFMVDFSELQFGKFLGRGGQGAVYAALYNDTPVAVKKTSHQEIFMHILSGSHDNIVAFRGWAADSTQDTYLIIEYCPRGTLDVMLHHTAFQFEIPKVLQIVRNIARGMLHLHKRRILHRDLKPGNIFVSPGQVMKIGDFGQSKHLDLINQPQGTLQRCLSEGVIGTAQYTAPELYNESTGIDSDSIDQTLKADVYSFGVTLYEILSKKRPFMDYDSYQIAYKWLVAPEEMALPTPILQDRDSQQNRNIFNGLVRIMKQCCEFEAHKRPSFEVITRELKSLMENNRPEKRPNFFQRAFGQQSSVGINQSTDQQLNSDKESDGKVPIYQAQQEDSEKVVNEEMPKDSYIENIQKKEFNTYENSNSSNDNVNTKISYSGNNNGNIYQPDSRYNSNNSNNHSKYNSNNSKIDNNKNISYNNSESNNTPQNIKGINLDEIEIVRTNNDFGFSRNTTQRSSLQSVRLTLNDGPANHEVDDDVTGNPRGNRERLADKRIPYVEGVV